MCVCVSVCVCVYVCVCIYMWAEYIRYLGNIFGNGIFWMYVSQQHMNFEWLIDFNGMSTYLELYYN